MLAGLHLPMLRLDHIFLPALNNGPQNNPVPETGDEVGGECGRNYIRFPVQIRAALEAEAWALLM